MSYTSKKFYIEELSDSTEFSPETPDDTALRCAVLCVFTQYFRPRSAVNSIQRPSLGLLDASRRAACFKRLSGGEIDFPLDLQGEKWVKRGEMGRKKGCSWLNFQRE